MALKIFAFLITFTGSFACFATDSPLQKIHTLEAHKAVGAYSQAIKVHLENVQSLVYVSGQVPLNPQTGQMVEGDIHQATNQALDNVEAILKAAGSDWKYVVRADVFLQNLDRDWEGMNEEYAKRFPKGIFPARQTVGVKLDDHTMIEISCVAIVPK